MVKQQCQYYNKMNKALQLIKWSRVARAHRVRLLRIVFNYIVFHSLVLEEYVAYDATAVVSLNHILYACIIHTCTNLLLITVLY